MDKRDGLEEFLSYFVGIDSAEKIAERTIVEQHADNKDKSHIYFLSPIAFPNIGSNEGLGIEIKSNGLHGIMFCTPSTHRDRHEYQILGTKEPLLLNPSEALNMIQYIDGIFKNKGILYIERKSKLNDKLKRAIKNLAIPQSIHGIIKEGERHMTLLSAANSILFNHYEKEESVEKLKDYFVELNQKVCFPEPLTTEEIDSIWDSVLKFVKQNKNTVSNANGKLLLDLKREEKAEGDDVIELAVEEILSNNHFIKIGESNEILYYENGVYISGGEVLIESIAEAIYEFRINNDIIKEIKGHIRRKTFTSIKQIDNDINIINLQNGLYDIIKDELRPHSPHYYSKNQVPVIYNNNAKPRLFGKFLSEVLYPLEIRTAIEVMTYTFYRDCPFEYYFKLFGYGANGKSVFTSLLTRLHGSRNVSNVSLLSLIKDRFALSDLENKSINIDTELSTAIIKDTSLLKKLTGGSR